MTTGKTIALIRQTFVDKVMSLLFHMLSRLVITFLPRSKRLLISWLQLPSAVILEPRKICGVPFDIKGAGVMRGLEGGLDVVMGDFHLSLRYCRGLGKGRGAAGETALLGKAELGKETACQCRRHERSRFDPWVGKIP